MTLSIIVGLAALGLLVTFFYRTGRMDLSGSIFAALLASGALALIVTIAIFGAQLFG